MDYSNLHSRLHEITFYFLKNKQSLMLEDESLSFKIKTVDKGLSEQYAELTVLKDKAVMVSFKLSEIIKDFQDEYSTEINLYLLRLYSNLEGHCKTKVYLHVCPECTTLHTNNSLQFNKSYLCNKCLIIDQYDSREIPEEKLGFIYFLESENTGLIKIGFSKNVGKRKKQIENIHGSELKILNSIKSLQKFEKYVHNRFNHLRQKGEWFSMDRDLYEFIENLSAKTYTSEDDFRNIRERTSI